MIFKRLLIIAFIVFLSSCSKPVPTERMDYVGDWQSSEMRLLILKDGTVAYKRLKGGGSTSINAPLQAFTQSGFTVGIWLFTTEFNVSEAPHPVEEGRWQMVVDGVRLTKL